MKTTVTKTNKLSLHKETLRRISDGDLGHVGGAGTFICGGIVIEPNTALCPKPINTVICPDTGFCPIAELPPIFDTGKGGIVIGS